MFCDLMQTVQEVGGGGLTRDTLEVAKSFLVPSMISSCFFVRGFINVYFGAGFHLSDTIFEFDIPVEVAQLDRVLDIAKSMLFFKVRQK